MLFGDRKVDFNQFTPDKDVPEARNSAFGKAYEANNPDLKRFIAHGGKLLLWHGESDPGPSPAATADYYQRALKATPGAANAVRLFMAPGVSHCGGGPGADSTDDLGVLDAWVTSGKAPEDDGRGQEQQPAQTSALRLPEGRALSRQGRRQRPRKLCLRGAEVDVTCFGKTLEFDLRD